MTKVLLVDDDSSLVGVVRRYLTAQGLSVVHTDNGSEALILVREAAPDVILLDAQMPGLDGHGVCRVVKKEARTRHIPVVMMSGARLEERDVLSGFEGGADDYIAKPFSLPILLARLQAVLRRAGPAGAPRERAMRRGGITLDVAGRTVKVGSERVELTPKQFDLLAVLMSKPGQVLAVPYLLQTVWGYDPADYNDPTTVEVHVCHLRKKLGPKAGRAVVNVVGHGYKFEAARR